jgi:hypothetical protein
VASKHEEAKQKNIDKITIHDLHSLPQPTSIMIGHHMYIDENNYYAKDSEHGNPKSMSNSSI